LASLACSVKSIFRTPSAWVRNSPIWIVDAHGGDGKRFVVREDEKLTALFHAQKHKSG
jgi:hypothetical protein